MTQSNQERARERLEQYQMAVKEIDYCRQRIDDLRDQTFRVTSTLGQSRAGRTGDYVIETVEGKREPGKPKPLPTEVSVPVLHIPRVQPGTRDPKLSEKILCGMMDQMREYEIRELKAIELCRMIETEIDAYCNHDQALALKYRYISGLTHKEARTRLHFSESSWFELFSSALFAFGEKSGVFRSNPEY